MLCQRDLGFLTTAIQRPQVRLAKLPAAKMDTLMLQIAASSSSLVWALAFLKVQLPPANQFLALIWIWGAGFSTTATGSALEKAAVSAVLRDFTCKVGDRSWCAQPMVHTVEKYQIVLETLAQILYFQMGV